MKDSELIERLKQASQGLLWLSESDYPFEVIYWENVDDIKAKLLQVTNCTPETKIEVRELDKFFSQATAEEDWYNDEEMAECKRYQELVHLLKTNLTDIKVYRVGETEVNCYILGQTKSGAIGEAGTATIAGLSTISVET
ncbi:MAG: nuclease A inhibitor family protein [Xenococcaceae cyanobacterium MO_188.B29]|nr:nuclease A inhibitor family protein [Xenococcaceae cyanobacterium MO_188.B29]